MKLVEKIPQSNEHLAQQGGGTLREKIMGIEEIMREAHRGVGQLAFICSIFKNHNSRQSAIGFIFAVLVFSLAVSPHILSEYNIVEKIFSAMCAVLMGPLSYLIWNHALEEAHPKHHINSRPCKSPGTPVNMRFSLEIYPTKSLRN